MRSRKTRTQEQRKRRYVRIVWEREARRAARLARTKMRDSDVTWYVAFSLSGKEFVAQRLLSEAGIFCHLPLSKAYRHVNKFKADKVRFAYPAIPGCLFIGMERGSENWLELSEMNAIIGVLGVAGEPKPVPGLELLEFVDRNAMRWGVRKEQRYMRSHKEYAVGDAVLIVAGPFAGNVVDVRSIKGDRAKIVLNILGKTQNIDIPLDHLEGAG